MKKMSSKQKQIISFIDRFISRNSYPPSIRDIQKGCSISSTSVVDYNLKILEERGIIQRHAEVSRGIRLLSRDKSSDAMQTVPVIGMIAAGTPIPVPSTESWDPAAGADTMEIPPELTQGKEGVYALRVKGESMIDALINDGDVVLMQHVTSIGNGEMAAVWLKSEKEATLKRVFNEGKRIRLQPANSQMKPFYAEPDNVEIQGRVIGVVRRVE